MAEWMIPASLVYLPPPVKASRSAEGGKWAKKKSVYGNVTHNGVNIYRCA